MTVVVGMIVRERLRKHPRETIAERSIILQHAVMQVVMQVEGEEMIGEIRTIGAILGMARQMDTAVAEEAEVTGVTITPGATTITGGVKAVEMIETGEVEREEKEKAEEEAAVEVKEVGKEAESEEAAREREGDEDACPLRLTLQRRMTETPDDTIQLPQHSTTAIKCCAGRSR
jgi:hypothetical protein